MPERRRPDQPLDQVSPAPRRAVLEPGESVAGQTGNTPKRPYAPETPHCDRRLAQILTQCGLAHFIDAFRQEGVLLEMLVGPQAGPWLKAYFPQVRAGAGRRLLQLAAEHEAGDSSTNHGAGSAAADRPRAAQKKQRSPLWSQQSHAARSEEAAPPCRPRTSSSEDSWHACPWSVREIGKLREM
jgi:hypothetical protein